MRSTTVKKGSTRAAHRSLFYAMGYTEEELKKPEEKTGKHEAAEKSEEAAE